MSTEQITRAPAGRTRVRAFDDGPPGRRTQLAVATLFAGLVAALAATAAAMSAGLAG